LLSYFSLYRYSLDPAAIETTLLAPGGGVRAMLSSPAMRRAAIAKDVFGRLARSPFVPQRLGAARSALASVRAQTAVLAPPAAAAVAEGGGGGGFVGGAGEQSTAAAEPGSSMGGRAAAAATLMLDMHVLFTAVTASSLRTAAAAAGDSPPPPPTLPFADLRIIWETLAGLDVRLADHPALQGGAVHVECS
jgi:hypothetical protein